MPSQKSSAPPKTWTSTITLLAIIVALLSALFYFLDSHLEWFYILNPSDLHDLSLRAISAHGNDTRGVVAFIVDELSEKLPGGYVNLDEEWIFNNAGGAMGAMYIIHASESPPQSLHSCLPSSHMTSHFHIRQKTNCQWIV
jgi:C-8 sterol isomerase